MLVKLILITTICSFVYARSVESPGEVQRLSLTGDHRFDPSMDTESIKIEPRRVRDASTTFKPRDGAAPQLPQSTPILIRESTHPGGKHPMKRAMNYKEDHQDDLRPGCCG